MSKKIKEVQARQRNKKIRRICREHGKHVAKKFLMEDFGMTKQEAFAKYSEVTGK